MNLISNVAPQCRYTPQVFPSANHNVACKVCGTPAPVIFTRTHEKDGVILEAQFHGDDYDRPYYGCPCCGLIFHLGFDSLTDEQNSQFQTIGMSGSTDMIVNRGVREVYMTYMLMNLYGLGLDSRMLVFGCGPGVSFNLFLQQQRDVFATDLFVGFADVREDIPTNLFKRELLPAMIRRFRGLDQLSPDFFDVITLTEVFEHFLDPVAEITRLVALLRPGGIVIGTTGCVDRVREPLKEWWYVKCQSHSTFLSAESFQRICEEAGCLGALLPGSPAIIGETNMSESQCVFVIQRPHCSSADRVQVLAKSRK